MKRRKHTPEQIVRKLREAGRMIEHGALVAEVRQHPKVENARLKQLLAEAEHDKAILSEVADWDGESGEAPGVQSAGHL